MTCDFCLDGRHIRCRCGECTCSMCATQRPKTPKRKARVLTATPAAVRKYDEYASLSCKVRDEWGKTGKKGKPKGWSSLPADVQADIESELRKGTSLSALSRKHGCSRDKVRNIKHRLERNGEILLQV